MNFKTAIPGRSEAARYTWATVDYEVARTRFRDSCIQACALPLSHSPTLGFPFICFRFWATPNFVFRALWLCLGDTDMRLNPYLPPESTLSAC